MDIKTQPNLKFHGVDFINIHLVSLKGYDGESEIELNISPKVFYPSDEPNAFKILMEVNLKCEEFFELTVGGIGSFEFDNEFNDETLKRTIVNSNSPAIMFPYVRAFISTLTTNLGNVTGPLLIPTQFFRGELEEVVESEN
jgi:preprotein translocase subunit SecB